MIELLGVGIPRRAGGWVLSRVCATLEAGALTVVLSADAEERRALLDVIAGRRLAAEGRVWIDRVPVMADSLGSVRRLCADIHPTDGLLPRRSVLWNALAVRGRPWALERWLPGVCRRERQTVTVALERVGLRARLGDPVATLSAVDRMRLLVGRALARRPRHLVVRDPDAALPADEIAALLAMLRMAARSDRLSVTVGLAEGTAGRGVADRVLRLREGRLLSHHQPDVLSGASAAQRMAALGS